MGICCCLLGSLDCQSREGRVLETHTTHRVHSPVSSALQATCSWTHTFATLPHHVSDYDEHVWLYGVDLDGEYAHIVISQEDTTIFSDP